MPEPQNDKPIISLHRSPRGGQPPEARGEDGPPPFPGLRFHLPVKYPRDALVDLRGFSRPRFAEQMARMIWADHNEGTRFRSLGTVRSVAALRSFDEYLALNDADGRVQAVVDVAPGDIDGFDLWAHDRWPEGSTMPFSHLRCLIKLLKYAKEHRFTAPGLAGRLDYISSVHTSVGGTPRDAYSPYVMAQIRAGARASVLASVERMAVVDQSMTPTGRRPSGTQEVLTHLRDHGFDVDAEGAIRTPSRFGAAKTRPEVLDLVYPRQHDLVAFAILLADDCGLPPECIHELGADCLEKVDADASIGFLTYIKRRRAGNDDPQLEPVKTKGPWSTGGLVRQLLELTATTRRQMRAEDGAQRLFVGRTGSVLKRQLISQSAIKAHLRRHPVTDEDGVELTSIELSRIRKTVKAERYAALGGDLARVGDDHSRRIFAKHYGVVEALSDTHDQAIASALAAGTADALATTVLPPEREREAAADPAAAAALLGVDKGKLANVLEGCSDVWLAGCLDFSDSPYAGTRGCGAPFWGCVDCRNAVVTKAKLPALLRLLEHLRGKRQEMSLAAFAQNFGFVFTRVQQIIGAFGPADIEAALEEVRDDIGPDWSIAQLTFSV